MKNNSSDSQSKLSKALWPLVIIAAAIAALFWRSFLPEFVHFSNDGPLGAQSVNFAALPGGFTGMWDDLNLIGMNAGTAGPGVSATIRWLFGAVGFSKFYQPFALFLLGAGAWAFFRALKLTPLAALLGALAVALNTGFFAGACWGVASAEIAIGFNFCALALVAANTETTPLRLRILRLALAGFCVGVNVMEAADVGALCSIFLAGYVFYRNLVQPGVATGKKIFNGVWNVAIVAACAGFVAVQVVTSLLGVGFTGTNTVGNQETPAAHWDWATQWSLPKAETLGAVVPGLFGYRMDTPNKLLPKSLEESYKGGVYWGGMGRTPEIDRSFDRGETPPPGGMMRFGYAGYYCGILVILIALWGVAQIFRKQNPVYSGEQKKLVAFWAVAALGMIFLAWGRFAPGSHTADGLLGYALLYKLPHFSDIRNPAKFFIFFFWAVTVLFAYGMDALSRRYLVADAKGVSGVRKWDGFDCKLGFGFIGLAAAGVIGWQIYSANKENLVQYIQKVGYGDPSFASDIAAFSIHQAGWFAGLLVVAAFLLVLVSKGFFSGPLAKVGGILIGLFIFLDLGRSNLPFIIHWDYKHKYEVGALNPILEKLRDKPWENRVTGPEEGHGVGIPFRLVREPRGFNRYFFNSGIYSIEWTQHHYLLYNIQSLDIIQMPRPSADISAYQSTLRPHAESDIYLIARFWQLTNTRYLLGAADWVEPMNQQLDPQHRFRIAQRFDIVAKPGITRPDGLEDLTAALAPDGDLALIEFTGALPRAKLYSNWQVNTNDVENLKTLAAPDFDPVKTVLISTPPKNLPAVATNENSGTVEFKSYSTKQIIFAANATAPSVLLLNDKFDENWRVTVDGKPAELLRCNFIMRGVALTPGAHTVQFNFSMPNRPLFITLTAIIIALFLAGLLVFLTRKPQNPASK